MNLRAFHKWVRMVYATRDEELDCEQLFEALPQYVDVKVAGEDADLCFPQVRHHLNQCSECYDLYLTLRDVALLESRQLSAEVTATQQSQSR